MSATGDGEVAAGRISGEATSPGRERPWWGPGRRLGRRFYDRSVLLVAPELLGKVLVREDGRRGRIVEVEAYGGSDDPGSHAHRGRTARNATMFGPGGLLYVYLSYGLHWCANVVCGPPEAPSAVLLRALEPIDGLDGMRLARARNGRFPPDRELCHGPGRLGRAFGLDRSFDGLDLVTGIGGLTIVDDRARVPEPVRTPRIGLSAGVDLPWRFSLGD